MNPKIEFDKLGNPIYPTLCIATKSGKILGALDAYNIEISGALQETPELNFTLYKFINGALTPHWADVQDLRLIYCPEWDTVFEAHVDINETIETTKSVSCSRLSDEELGQIMLYNYEINTELDIDRPDYVQTIFYNEDNPKGSLLNRLLEKCPHYQIGHVDSTLKTEQRTFSFDGVSVFDAFTEIEEELNCLIIPTCTIQDGKLERKINAFDLQQKCKNPDCGYRGEILDKCPKCGSDEFSKGYGENTNIFITSDFLSDSVSLSSNARETKNCFKLVAGDDLMTDTIRACNPSGSDYLWRFSDAALNEMSSELRERILEYFVDYNQCQTTQEFIINEELLNQYNIFINEKYKEFNEDLHETQNPLVGFPKVMEFFYDTIDLELFLTSGLMPSIEIDKQSAEEQVNLLQSMIDSDTNVLLTTIGVSSLRGLSVASANNAIVSYLKTILDPRFQIKIYDTSQLDELEFSKKWTGQIKITSYSDEEDTAISPKFSVEINSDRETDIKQRLDKILNSNDQDNLDIISLFKMDLESFNKELKQYSLNRLSSFNDACQSCIDMLIEQGVADRETWGDQHPDLYVELYLPYLSKLDAIGNEMKVRESEIKIISDLQDSVRDLIEEIQESLNLEVFLGVDLWLELVAYRREDTFSNDNYISDGLNNAELFKKAIEFIDKATIELEKAAAPQYTLSTDLYSLIFHDPQFKNLKDNFKLGNYIYVGIDDTPYKVRLLNYNIRYDDTKTLPLTLSTAIRSNDTISELQDTLSKASSIATSYNSVKRQAAQGAESNDKVNDLLTNGFNLTSTMIANSENQNQTWGEHGLLCREYDPITETYGDTQLKIINSTLAITNDNWQTAKAAIGKYKYLDKNNEEQTAFGVLGETIVGRLFIGETLQLSNSNSTLKFDKDGFLVKNETNAFHVAPDADSLVTIYGNGEPILSVNPDGKLTIVGDITARKLTLDPDVTIDISAVEGLDEKFIKRGKVIGSISQEDSTGFFVSDEGKLTARNALIYGDIYGNLHSTVGEIAGFTIGRKSLTYNTNTFKTNATSMYVGTDGISCGEKFSVDNEGAALAEDMTINGGNIAGWSIEKKRLVCPLVPPMDYTQTDVDIVTKFLNTEITLTNEEYKKYDIDNNGEITEKDLNVISTLVEGGITVANYGYIVLDSQDWLNPIKITNHQGDVISSFGIL